MARSVEEKVVIGIGALALLVLAGRVLHLLLAGVGLVSKKPGKAGAEGRRLASGPG